jgi:lipoprotein-anchoring transpeptidase ErfK/SrfK
MLAPTGGAAGSRRLSHPARAPVSFMKRSITAGACLIALSAGCGTALATSAPAPPAAHQELVQLFATHSVHVSPDGPVVASVSARRPLTGERTMLPVLSSEIDNSVEKSGELWLDVLLPGRVLGHKAPPKTGWISASNTVISSTGWHLIVDLGARRVLVYDNGVRVKSYAAVVGKPSTPTPTGDYFIEENVQMPAGAPGAPFALATSDRSSVLREFEGGPGQIAIHGRENLGGKLGTAESHGCIRLATAAIDWLAARLGPGVPLTIVA